MNKIYECRWGVPPPAYSFFDRSYFFFFGAAFLAAGFFFVATQLTSLQGRFHRYPEG